MTQRASDLLAEVADRLSTDATQSGMVVAEAVRAIEPELLKGYKDGTIDELVNMSISFLRALFRSLRPDSKLPWPEYYTQAREYARRYAEKGVPLESLMEGLAIFRRTVVARVTDELGESPYADEVLLLAQSRLGDVIEHLNSMFIRGYLDWTESKYSARQSELRGLYHIAVALDRARQHTKEARADYLTGLANRPEFERAIDRAVASADRHKRRLALMMIDLDNLKEINDTYGHHVGDEAIRVLAAELQRAVRATDTCGRLGGDEFGVAMPDADERDAREVGIRVREALDHLNRTAKLPVPVEFSIGITAWRQGLDWQAMYQSADKALYVDKRRRHAARKRLGEASG